MSDPSAPAPDVPSLRDRPDATAAAGASLRSDRPDDVGRDRPRAAGRWLTVGAGLLAAGIGALALAAALVIFGLARRGDAFLDDVAGAFGAGPTPTAALTADSVVVERLRAAAELTTLVTTLETVVSASEDRELAGFKIGSTELLYIARGQVRAGIDLAKLDTGDVDVERRRGEPIGAPAESIVVELPAPEILGASIDVARSRVYDVRRSLFGPVDPDLQSRAERYALERIVESACDSEVLETANDHARIAVEALLEAAGAADVTVRTQRPGPCRWPPPTP